MFQKSIFCLVERNQINIDTSPLNHSSINKFNVIFFQNWSTPPLPKFNIFLPHCCWWTNSTQVQKTLVTYLYKNSPIKLIDLNYSVQNESWAKNETISPLADTVIKREIKQFNNCYASQLQIVRVTCVLIYTEQFV